MPRVRNKYPKKQRPLKVNIDPEMCLTTQEAAEILGLKERMVRYRCRWGQLPSETVIAYIKTPRQTVGIKTILINKKAVMMFDYLRRVHNRYIHPNNMTDKSE